MNGCVTLTIVIFPLTQIRFWLWFLSVSLLPYHSSPYHFSLFSCHCLSSLQEASKRKTRQGERQISANLCHILTGWNKIFTFLLTVSLSFCWEWQVITFFLLESAKWSVTNLHLLCAQNSLYNLKSNVFHPFTLQYMLRIMLRKSNVVCSIMNVKSLGYTLKNKPKCYFAVCCFDIEILSSVPLLFICHYHHHILVDEKKHS